MRTYMYLYKIQLLFKSFRIFILFFQFANTVAGTGIENWQNFGGSLGFSRGNKGFFAMGDLNNVEFYTGLPDGDYCDIIHDCAQTIHVSGGKAFFNKAEANDPVAAICVGCQNIF